MKRYTITTRHGESGSLFYVVDTAANSGEQPAVVQTCERRREAEIVAEALNSTPRKTYGWNHHGEYHCPCGIIFGKNLLGESPVALVTQHLQTCLRSAKKCLATGHPPGNRPERYSEDTWQRAVVEYFGNAPQPA
jgi:hypothetical protein